MVSDGERRDPTQCQTNGAQLGVGFPPVIIGDGLELDALLSRRKALPWKVNSSVPISHSLVFISLNGDQTQWYSQQTTSLHAKVTAPLA
ncbi:hypothetical protein T265_10685 [Opisthorchis viverrini]|uniref:Uncharacterized protein n=1 Tax=Opisthorchis viverrini TaxID=6198 RepID=A0A074ZCA8_OPIVI|nr:hypothetical protein T265_10685 [Opisthorchis viverrini]KER20840.1 hypothetical protein T265_10685 [Opisthorchis viverrini]